MVAYNLDMPVQELLSNNILLIRKEKKLTQTELAEKAKITRKHLCAIEKGRVFPSATIIDSIASALDVPVSFLFEDRTRVIQKDSLYSISEKALENILSTIPHLFREELEREARKCKGPTA
mgnify:CR=1 FL=1